MTARREGPCEAVTAASRFVSAAEARARAELPAERAASVLAPLAAAQDALADALERLAK